MSDNCRISKIIIDLLEAGLKSRLANNEIFCNSCSLDCTIQIILLQIMDVSNGYKCNILLNHVIIDKCYPGFCLPKYMLNLTYTLSWHLDFYIDMRLQTRLVSALPVTMPQRFCQLPSHSKSQSWLRSNLCPNWAVNWVMEQMNGLKMQPRVPLYVHGEFMFSKVRQ